MSTPISDTSALYARLEEVLGHDHADTLMTYLPPEPGAQLATRSDVAVLVGDSTASKNSSGCGSTPSTDGSRSWISGSNR